MRGEWQWERKGRKRVQKEEGGWAAVGGGDDKRVDDLLLRAFGNTVNL